jgi:hypothetical protein
MPDITLRGYKSRRKIQYNGFGLTGRVVKSTVRIGQEYSSHCFCTLIWICNVRYSLMFIYIHNLSYYLIFLHQESEHEVDNITFIQYRTFGISNRIGGVIVSMLTSSVVGRGFEPPSGQTKDNKIGICCFSILLYICPWVSDCCLTPTQQFSAISWREQVNFE